MTSTAASTSLAFRHIFGVNTNVVDNISYTDDDTIVYVAGHSLVLYNVLDKRQRFIQSAEITDSITAYCSGSGKRLAAVAERGEHPSFHVFDLRTFRRKKTVTLTEILSKTLISMQFSEDNQLLLVLSGFPDYTLMCWNWAKAKLIAEVVVSGQGSTVSRCMFSPLDASVATVIGQDFVKFYRIGEKEMRPLQDNVMPNNSFTSFCWMRYPDDHLLAGTGEGKILLFRSGEFITMLPGAPDHNLKIASLTAIPGGFVAGSGPGVLMFYHYDESKDQALFDTQFQLVNIVNLAEFSSGFINSIALDPKDETLCLITSDGQLLSCPATKTAGITAKDVSYTVSPFHGPKTITGLDVALRKPLLMTCSKDTSLRLWNLERHEMELVKTFAEEMYCVALHPTGLHCAVGFTDKLRIYHILVDDLRICMEVQVKGCRDCKFSNGGHVFAAASGNSIIVYDFYTGEKIADLRGHNGKVRSLHWMPSGFQLLSSGADGAAYVWNLDGARRTGEFIFKGKAITSIVNTNTSVITVGEDRSLRELMLPDLATINPIDAGLVLKDVQMSLTKNVLFASTCESGKPGYVRSYPYPLTGDFDDYACTDALITRMRLTADETFLVVTDDQGCVCLMEVKSRQDRFQRNNPAAYSELTSLHDWSDEILVTRGELDDFDTTVAELHTKVEELKLNNEYQLKLKDMNNAERIKETTDKFVQELELAKSKLEMLQDVRVDYEIESIEKIKYIEEMHQNNIQNLETGFQAQIMEMVDNYQKLVRDRDGQVERLDMQRQQLVKSHERYVEELTADFERKLDEERQARLQLDDERGELERELDEMQNQLEDDIDTEIENMKRQYEDKLAQSRETTLKYKGENGIMKKKSVLLQRDIEDQKEEMKLLMSKEKELHDQIKMLEKEVSAHKKEIKTRDISIGEKEKRIYELKKKNQELDKFKFVLDFKIRELKQQIEPRQMEIMAMREKIKEMDNELERFHKSNAALDTLIGDLRDKIDEIQGAAKNRRTQAKLLENMTETARSEVQAAIAHIQTPTLLLPAVKAIVDNFGSKETVRPQIDTEVEDEYSRHKAFLQKSIQDLKKQLDIDSDAHMAVKNDIRQNNMNLINEINNQRESNRNLKIKVQADIGRIRHLAQAQNMRKGKKGGSVASGTASLQSGNSGASAIFAASEEVSAHIEPTDLLNKNRKRIAALRAAIAELEARATSMMQKAISKEVLPPMDGATAAAASSAFNGYNIETGDSGRMDDSPRMLPAIGNVSADSYSTSSNQQQSAAAGKPLSRQGSGINAITLPPVFATASTEDAEGIAAADAAVDVSTDQPSDGMY